MSFFILFGNFLIALTTGPVVEVTSSMPVTTSGWEINCPFFSARVIMKHTLQEIRNRNI
jgi:hypothetical protein